MAEHIRGIPKLLPAACCCILQQHSLETVATRCFLLLPPLSTPKMCQKHDEVRHPLSNIICVTVHIIA
jgi:hypothetical protein